MLFSVHPWCFGHRVAIRGDGAGQNGTVGGGSFYDPQRVSIGFGAPGHPADLTVDASGSSGKITGIDLFASVGSKDRVDMFADVGVNTYERGCCTFR